MLREDREHICNAITEAKEAIEKYFESKELDLAYFRFTIEAELLDIDLKPTGHIIKELEGK